MKNTRIHAITIIGLIIVVGMLGYAPPALLGTAPSLAHAAETRVESAGRHIFLDPAEVHQPAAFSVNIEGSSFPPGDTLMLMTDAGYSATPACASNSVDGASVTTDPEGGFAITGHFAGCFTNTVNIVVNDDGHLYRTILDID